MPISQAVAALPAWATALIAEWTMTLESENKSPKTILCYTDVVRKFHVWLTAPIAPPDTADPEGWLALVPPAPGGPEDYRSDHVKAWITYRLATTSPGNANNNYRSLQPYFKWLIEEEELDVNPMAKLKPPHVPDQPPPVPAVDVIKRVLKVCDGKDFLSRRDEAIIRLICDTGGRLSEVANIDMDKDLDLSRRVVEVVGKGGKRRCLPFTPSTGKAIGRYLRVRARHPEAETTSRLWLGGRRGRGALSGNGIKLMFRRRGKEAGVEEHLGRHFQPHHFLRAGGSEGDLMLLNGWTTPQMARRYGRSAATERAHESAQRIRVGDLL